MAGQGNKGDCLLEIANSNMEQSIAIALHIGADPCARDHPAAAVQPTNRMRTGRRAGCNPPSSCEQADVELQSLLLQAYSLPGSRHFHRSISSECKSHLGVAACQSICALSP